jgi:hypothetical protein
MVIHCLREYTIYDSSLLSASAFNIKVRKSEVLLILRFYVYLARNNSHKTCKIFFILFNWILSIQVE